MDWGMKRRTEGRTDGRTDRKTDRRTDRRNDERTDNRTEEPIDGRNDRKKVRPSVAKGKRVHSEFENHFNVHYCFYIFVSFKEKNEAVYTALVAPIVSRKINRLRTDG